MYPILLQFGGFTLRSYGFMAMLGFLTAWVLMRFNRRHAGLSDDQTSSLLLIAMAAGIGGARIFYVALNWEYYSRHWTRIIRIDQGGLVFYGGFLLAMASVIAYCKFRKLDVVRVLDVFAPAMAAAHAWGRVGCFLNGCCFGSPTDCALGVAYPNGSAARMCYPEDHLHPVQLYEAAENIAACGLYWYLVRRGRRGMAMSAYMCVYGICRFANEFLRGDNPHWSGLTPAQWIGLGLIPVGGALMIYFGTRRSDGAKTA